MKNRNEKTCSAYLYILKIFGNFCTWLKESHEASSSLERSLFKGGKPLAKMKTEIKRKTRLDGTTHHRKPGLEQNNVDEDYEMSNEKPSLLAKLYRSYPMRRCILTFLSLGLGIVSLLTIQQIFFPSSSPVERTKDWKGSTTLAAEPIVKIVETAAATTTKNRKNLTCKYSKYNHPSLIVIGEMKCATSTLYYALNDHDLFPEMYGSKGYEAQWYTWTMKENLNQSLKRIRSNEFAWPNFRKERWSFDEASPGEEDVYIRQRRLKLFEKSPPYVLLPHLPIYLSEEFVPCNLKVLLMIRHPIRRLWSQFWHQSEVKNLFSQNFQNVLRHSQYTHRFHKLHGALVTSSSMSKDQREQYIMDQWQALMYDDKVCCQLGTNWGYYGFCCQFDILVRSCYYPAILWWDRHIDQPQNHFRVLSYEAFFRDPALAIQRLRCWLHDDIDSDVANDKEGLCKSLVGYVPVKTSKKHMGATDGREIPQDTFQILTQMFEPCETLLMQYLHEHPYLILGQQDTPEQLWSK
ncbi:hypothetical protein RFI_09051 [Reticulomyxa filosa]|uniref:Uncharacterized protein n=1 Tax=Reticulomyxa filosa TaxID=46433 RepID=X6NQ86_RETFI|nr:hypothetical protein RFI_09051 [Reticulomyxa filosa]|eukprot:ETO28083.1 hypothetical protein RFI_09051 [Reticulomyxa filosa]